MKAGARVGAIKSVKDGVAYFFGYGTYEGDEIPVEGTYFMGVDMNKVGHKSPKIILDVGDVVYGCECWWGSKEGVESRLKDCKRIEYVTVRDHRDEVRKIIDSRPKKR